MKVIVDTNKYAGNFEREMCAYATGQVGECEVGSEEVDENMPHAKWWEKHVIHQEDEGCYRPVALSATPGYINDGMGGHYVDTPENRELACAAAVEKMIAYYKPQRDMIERRLRENDFEEENGGRGWTEEACHRTIKSMDDRVQCLRDRKQVSSAYQSIEIVVNEPPPGIVMIHFESRIHEFAKREGIKILAIRVVK
jgi:hypothetical protein